MHLDVARALIRPPSVVPLPQARNITNFAKNGLDSGYQLCPTGPCPGAAFPGVSTAVGPNEMLFPIGRSVYNGLQMGLKQDVSNPVRGIKHANLQVSYSLSRYVATARDNDFSTAATDFVNPSHYIGPTALDRTHQLSFGGYMDLPAGFQLGFTGHFDSPLASNVTLPVTWSTRWDFPDRYHRRRHRRRRTGQQSGCRRSSSRNQCWRVRAQLRRQRA